MSSEYLTRNYLTREFLIKECLTRKCFIVGKINIVDTKLSRSKQIIQMPGEEERRRCKKAKRQMRFSFRVVWRKPAAHPCLKFPTWKRDISDFSALHIKEFFLAELSKLIAWRSKSIVLSVIIVSVSFYCCLYTLLTKID